MSVVNKMLQDLEARNSQPDEVNADYQPPQKKSLRWVYILLFAFAITAIAVSFLDINQFIGNKEQVVSEDKANALAKSETKKIMLVTPDKSEVEITPDPVKTSATIVNESENTAKSLTDDVAPSAEAEQPALQIELTVVPAPEKVPQEPLPAANNQSSPSPAKPTSFSMSGSSKENQSTNLKQRIAESLNSNDLDLAQSLLSELLLDEPDNLKARKKLASLYFSQGNYALSKQLLLRGIDLHPNQTDLRLMLARLYAVQDNIEQAMQVMIDVEPNATNQVEYLAYRAALAQQLKQPEMSKADYLALAAIEASNAKWWLGLAIALDQLGETSNAISAYEKAYTLGQLDDSVDEFIQQRISVLAGSQ